MGDDRIWFRPKRGLESKIEAFEETNASIDDRSQAIRQLIEIGYREATEPLGRRARDVLVEWASKLAMFGVLAFVLALTHPSLQQSDGVLLGVSLLTVAVAMLAIAGVIRVLTGHGETGFAVHKSVRELLEVVR